MKDTCQYLARRVEETSLSGRFRLGWMQSDRSLSVGGAKLLLPWIPAPRFRGTSFAAMTGEGSRIRAMLGARGKSCARAGDGTLRNAPCGFRLTSGSTPVIEDDLD